MVKHIDSDKNERDAAAAVIRNKLSQLYNEEPDAVAEIQEAEVVRPHSKHQVFMAELAASGKSLAEIQTEWHHYYVTLPDNEKHEVWQEFYASNESASKYHKAHKLSPSPAVARQVATEDDIAETQAEQAEDAPADNAAKPRLLAVHPAPRKPAPKVKDLRSAQDVRKLIRHHVSAGGQLQTKHHLQSLLFGIGMGVAVLLIFLFGFFNEVIIAPFIQPKASADATPLILSNDGVAPTTSPEVIIPKINVEIPVDYSQTTTNEASIENALESGIVHYPTTVQPGQKGNAAYFGHSSNNIFNKGKYKFAFVLLHTLVNGDTFYLTKDGKVYVYKVISKTVVPPTNVGVLGPVAGQTATATLITCDPPGTSLNRLVVVGQQISPDPAGNAAGTPTINSQQSTTTDTEDSEKLPGNGPTLWGRIRDAIF